MQGITSSELLYLADVCAGLAGFSELCGGGGGRDSGLRGKNDFNLYDFHSTNSELFEPHYGLFYFWVKNRFVMFEISELLNLKTVSNLWMWNLLESYPNPLLMLKVICWAHTLFMCFSLLRPKYFLINRCVNAWFNKLFLNAISKV